MKDHRKPITQEKYNKKISKILNSCLPIEEKIQALCDEASKWRIKNDKKNV